MAGEEDVAYGSSCSTATATSAEQPVSIHLRCISCSDEVAHLRSEQQAAREESLRLGAAAEKRAAIGECGWWSGGAGSSMYPELLSRAACLVCVPSQQLNCKQLCSDHATLSTAAEAQIRELSALNEQLQKQVGCCSDLDAAWYFGTTWRAA